MAKARQTAEQRRVDLALIKSLEGIVEPAQLMPTQAGTKKTVVVPLSLALAILELAKRRTPAYGRRPSKNELADESLIESARAHRAELMINNKDLSCEEAGGTAVSEAGKRRNLADSTVRRMLHRRTRTRE
jgi:hypothetical protein